MSDLSANINKTTAYLARFRDGGILNRIGGQDMPGSLGTFKNATPIDESHTCDVARGGGAQDVDAAAKAAAAAFPAWRDMPAGERKKILIRIAEGGIEARAEEIAFCECWDTGQALRFMSKAAIRGGPRTSVISPIRSAVHAMERTCVPPPR